MADDQPVDPTAAIGMPEETGTTDSDDPKTLTMPARWSGAAAIPGATPRRSAWGRLRERVADVVAGSGSGRRSGTDDEWPTMPAVDPWADQPTQVWDEAYTAAPAAPPVPPEEMPPTRMEGPAVAAAEGTRQERVAALNARLDAASAAADIVEKKAAEAAKAAAASAAAKAEAARAAVARKLAERAEEKARAAAQAPPTPQTPPPPQAPFTRQAPPAPTPAPARKPRFWQRPAAAPPPKPAMGPQPLIKPRTPIQPRRPAQPAPPPWAAKPMPKRRGFVRRALRRLTILTMVAVVLCCGAPLAYTQIPAARQFPVDAILPDSFSDLVLRETESAKRAVERLAEQLQEAGSGGNAFAGVYSDGNGKRVTVYGATGFRLTPGSDVSAQMDRLAGSMELTDVSDYDTGVPGVHERCGTGRLDDTAVVACSWADHGSLATVLLTRRSLDESAALVAQLRDEVLVPAI
ncbi:hypothetical protein [Actinoplanes sp. NPDC023714]|uniref:hypothetical protein n=1 Tax=Actinoplanes sp. NPDC023714 TaxID=3154322 RepID=UPI0033F6A050